MPPRSTSSGFLRAVGPLSALIFGREERQKFAVQLEMAVEKAVEMAKKKRLGVVGAADRCGGSMRFVSVSETVSF